MFVVSNLYLSWYKSFIAFESLGKFFCEEYLGIYQKRNNTYNTAVTTNTYYLHSVRPGFSDGLLLFNGLVVYFVRTIMVITETDPHTFSSNRNVLVLLVGFIARLKKPIQNRHRNGWDKYLIFPCSKRGEKIVPFGFNWELLHAHRISFLYSRNGLPSHRILV